MSLPVAVKTYACMAEARAAYYAQGYVTLNNTLDGSRYVLVRDYPGQILSSMVALTRTGFLTVEVEHVE